MGVFRPRGRSDSRVSGLPFRRSPFVDDEAPDAIEPPVEQANNDPARYSSQGLREQTAELASYALSLNGSSLPQEGNTLPPSLDIFHPIQDTDLSSSPADTVVPKPLDTEPPTGPIASSSALTEMIRKPSDTLDGVNGRDSAPKLNELGEGDASVRISGTAPGTREAPSTEQTSLLPKSPHTKPFRSYGIAEDVESQDTIREHKQNAFRTALSSCMICFQGLMHPKSWNGRKVWEQGVIYPVSLLPSVFLGLLLNILDALSYGMILFPLGEPIFSDLGSDGISMFYVSTIIAQLVFSSGGSIFRGGIGSEMIEVVPFFHQMAFTILARVGQDNPRSVIATTILSFSASSVLTGLVFFLMGTCKLGSLIGFFPRHILIGCIGGVGFFLLMTGVEVSARLPGSLEFTLPTLEKLSRSDTVPLWLVPLLLAIGLLVMKRFVRSNFLVGGYFIGVAVIFYIVKLSAKIPMDTLRKSGWVFEAPSSNNPWWHFYTLYGEFFLPMIDVIFLTVLDFAAVDWAAFLDTIPAMFALTFFGVLHVPINVPALGISTGEDNLNVDRELMAHGVTNALSGFSGSIQVVIIVVTMGAWDFVVGIFVGIILACMSFVVQTSRKSAIRATFSGKIAGSTVRRPPIQQRFLREAGQQTLIIKLGGYLFFGTIVDVENTMRGLIEEEAFNKRPIRFIILDFSRVYGIDFSAAEAFTRINRILRKRNVLMTISGLNTGGDVGRSLQNVGLFESGTSVQIFEDFNSALEFCENDYLKVFYSHREALLKKNASSTFLEVPGSHNQRHLHESIVGSPRHRHLQQAATTTLREDETAVVAPTAWASMRQPLPLLLQTFQGLTSRNEDFWFRACTYFVRDTYAAGTVLFQEGDVPNGFYLLESGMLRAEYELPQGRYFELIVAGRPCGELPFFSETRRTATVKAEQECVAWRLTTAKWRDLREREPEIARELLTVSLKLTTERMDSITS
ncbi:hypothetical protein APSETT444_010109 [Aspergillus pseudonomiae]